MVRFVFGANSDRKNENGAEGEHYLATGLYREVYELVAACGARRHARVYAAAPATPGNRRCHPSWDATRRLRLHRVLNGLMFALLFSRTPLRKTTLTVSGAFLRTTRGIEFEDWHPFTGYFPRETKLFWEGNILAGTLSGMIEPFWDTASSARCSRQGGALAHSSKTRAGRWIFTGLRAVRQKARAQGENGFTPVQQATAAPRYPQGALRLRRNPALAKATRDPVRWFT